MLWFKRILPLAMVLLAACDTTKTRPAGDATVRVTTATSFSMLARPARLVALEFPSIDLGNAGEHRFRVRGLTVPMFPDEIRLSYPALRSHSIDVYREAWGEATLRIEFVDLSGFVFFSDAVRFSEARFERKYGTQVRPEFWHCLAHPTLAASLKQRDGPLDYDVRLVVETPAKSKGHMLRLGRNARGDWLEGAP